MSIVATYPMTCKRGHFGAHRWTSDGRRYCADCRSETTRAKLDTPLRASRTTKLERTDSRTSLDSRPEGRVELTGPLVVVGADGIERYRIDEWQRRFGRPQPSIVEIESE